MRKFDMFIIAVCVLFLVKVTAIELLDYCIAASNFVLLNVPKFDSPECRNNVKNTFPCPTHLNVSSKMYSLK